ncbi:histidine kinase [Archangium violaceum]|uniref:sensor histidine kinase n=1 Tax=Archangium violaceum TaxID=83451 RepID=UPI0019511A03|nr:ATP-binding protein [Archangium violaceum]QRN96348.1 histidine kinase [Archangium violaceum]
MTDDPSELQALRRVKRKSYFVCAAVFLGGVSLHWVQLGTFVPALALLNVAWSASFVCIGLAVGAGWIPVRWSAVWGASVSLVVVTVYLHLTGGPSSIYFPMLCTLPLFTAMFSPNSRGPTWLASVATLGAVAVLDVLSGMSPRVMLVQLWGFSLLGVMAAYGARTYRRMREAEKAAQQEMVVAQREMLLAQREMLAALEQLAESERLRRRAEVERAEVERLVVVGQLASGVAHEVNNPLAFVKSNLCFIQQEVLREDGPLDRAELRDVLAETQEGVMRIQQIVKDLRRFSREGDGGEAEGRPEAAMHEAQRLASVRLRGLGEVSLEIPPGLPAVRLGQRQLVQVLVNLLLNAADAVETAVPARRAHILMKAWRVEGGVRLEVEDNGPGIAPELLQRIFEPFFTTRPPGDGTGLGLALCREYVSRVGGSLVAENRAEGGARLVLVLPAVPALTSAAA